MGCMTDDMSRLHGEISSLRRARETFLKDLEKGRYNRKLAVSEMRANFAFSRTARARRMKADLSRFVGGLKSGISARRRELNADRAGARRVWCGAASRATVPLFERPMAVESVLQPEKRSKRKGG